MQIRGVHVSDGSVDVDPATELVFSSGALTDLGRGKVGVASGGSQPVTFDFAFNTPDLSDGVVFWTPGVDMWLRDAWFYVPTGWDGTTPFADVGVIADGHGLFYAGFGTTAVDISVVATWTAVPDALSFLGNSPAGANQFLSYCVDPYNAATYNLPVRVAAGTPVAIWVSQDGTPGGADPGASQGVARITLDVIAA